jgi:hypothetical protein
MPDALLTTKLHIPQAAPEFVPRPHLTTRLNKGLLLKLNLVSLSPLCPQPTHVGIST